LIQFKTINNKKTIFIISNKQKKGLNFM